MTEGEKPGAPAPAPPPIQPIPMTVIGVRSEGTGAPIPDGQVLITPDHQPNVVVQVIRPIVAIAIRAINVFLNTLVGGLGLSAGAAVTNTFPWATWQGAIVIAASAALVNVIWSCITIFGDLEKKHPLLTGSI